MAPVVLAPLLAKGVGLGASALKYLPVIGAVGGAIPGLRKGNVGEALLGSGFGALTGSLGTGGLITGATGAVGRMAPAGGALRGGAGLVGYGATRGENMAVGGTPLPPGMGQYGGISPIGDPLNVLSPLGLDAGRRLRTVKDAEALRDAQNILLPTVRKYAEQAKRDEFARNMAAAGIKTNIALNAQLAGAMQQAGLQMGTTAAEQAGAAITRPYQY